MAFQLVHLSQQDPKWKTDTLGFGDPGDTIGYVGCALTSTAMLISGHGYPETPRTLNQKLKNVNGFAGSGIAWWAVSKIYPQINVRSTGLLNDRDAPIAEIDASLAAGQPVVVLIDYAPDADLDWHYVLIYEKRDNDYMILDPWPLNEPNGVLLMSRFGHKRPLKRAIFQVVFFQCTVPGDGSSIPSSSTTTTPASTPSTPAVETNFFVEVQPMEAPGLRLRAQSNTNFDSVTLAMEPGGTQLRAIEAEAGARQKVGQLDQWIRVRDPNGLEGYVAAWFVMLPAASTPGDTPTDEEPSGETPAINRSRPSIGDGLENIPLEAPADQRINSNSLLARIWNKYGGLLAPIAEKMNFDPAIAVAILAQESGGQPYGADGRLIIRFENHLFYEYWGKRNVSAYNNHFQTGSPAWTGHKWRAKANAPWRNCHTSQGVEWEVFALASKLDDGAAKKSISMGLPQVLGSNFGILGFASVQDMFNAFVAHERNQVVAFFDFLQGNGPTATNALKTRDFRTIASIYNGAGNAEYYGKLIGNHYTTFIALRGYQPPVSSTPTTTPPSTSTGEVYARVKADATLGLNLRSSTDASGMTNVVATIPASTQLLILDENGAAKVGVMNQWIRVREPGGREGFVAAWHLEKVEATTPPVETEPESGPVEEAPASPSTTVPAKLQVIVKASGTKIYSSASASATVVATEKAGARLTVVETAEGAKAKIGIKGKRINVKATNNKRGYVGAESVKLP